MELLAPAETGGALSSGIISGSWSEQLLSLLNQTDWAEDDDLIMLATNFSGRHRVQQTTMSSEPSTPPAKLYCGEGLETFRQTYLIMHGYISLMVCLFGMLANTLNIIVLTRMDQRISPTNAILTGLALADNLVMIEYIPFAFHMYILRERPVYERFSYPWTVYVLIHAHVTQVFHTISIWLTLLLAVWRYLSVAHPLRSRDWCTLDRAFFAIFLAYVCSPLVCIPLYLTFTIQEQPWRPPGMTSAIMNGTAAAAAAAGITPDGTSPPERMLYFLGTSELAKANHSLLENINFWTYSVVVKLFPCVALTILSFRLISALVSAKERRQNLKSNNVNKNNGSVVVSSTISERSTTNLRGGAASAHPESAVERGAPAAGSEKHDRTTRMLLAVLFLFLVTEFPQGILALLSGILGDAFFTNCYGHLGELMDILALINGAINFILYCLMSRQFRQTFNRIFRPRMLEKWNGAMPMSVGGPHSTVNHNNQSTIVTSRSAILPPHAVVNSLQPPSLAGALLSPDPRPVVV